MATTFKSSRLLITIWQGNESQSDNSRKTTGMREVGLQNNNGSNFIVEQIHNKTSQWSLSQSGFLSPRYWFFFTVGLPDKWYKTVSV